MKKVTCDWCGKIIILNYKNSYRKDNKNNFCSRKCKGRWWSKYYIGRNSCNWQGGKVKFYCDFCDKIFFNFKSRKKKKRNFCSYKCRDNWYSKNIRGKNHPSYIDGKSRFPYILEFNYNKESIRKRDKYKCKLCGITQKKHIKKYNQKLHIHHIDYSKNHADHKRLVALCRKCNGVVNFNRDYYFAYFNYILNNIL